jgi:hypothetical protein
MAQGGSMVASAQNVINVAVNIVALLLIRRIAANQVTQANLIEVF